MKILKEKIVDGKKLYLIDDSDTVIAQKGFTFLSPSSSKLPRSFKIPYSTPSSELASSIGGENSEPAYLIPTFKYGKPLSDPEGEFRKTKEHLGGPFKTWQEAEDWEKNIRHPYVEKGQDIPSPYKWWGEGFEQGGRIKADPGFSNRYNVPIQGINASDNTRTYLTPNFKLTEEELAALKKSTTSAKAIADKEATEKAARLAKSEQAYKKRQETGIQSSQDLADETGAIGDKVSLQNLPYVGKYIPNELDVTGMLGNMASGLGKIPLNLEQGNYGQAAFSVAMPLGVGALAGLGNPSTGEFINNVLNPIPFSKEAFEKTGKFVKDNVVAAKIYNNARNIPNITEPIADFVRVNPMNRSSIGKTNDFLQHMSNDEFENYVSRAYYRNQNAYNMPLVKFKSTMPSSFYPDISTASTEEGLLFKEKFCMPGSQCAESANSVNSKMYTDLTGKEYDYSANAHNAWHMEDQMTRHGAQLSPPNLKIGDRVLMGNGIDQSTYVPGYTADRTVRHAGTIAGITDINGKAYPVLFESGRNNPMHANLLSHTFVGEGSVKKIIRPSQFIGDDIGKGVVRKNIRYAFRDKPSVANYSSGNKKIQSLLDESENFREVIKNNHDITNDEFDALRNYLVSIGVQETKLGGALPGSLLSKAKIASQDVLNSLNLTSPIKKAYNTTAEVVNKFQKVDKSLPKYPGHSIVEKEAILLAEKEGIPVNEAIMNVKRKYQPLPTLLKKNTTPSNGMFRQKEQTTIDRLGNLGRDLKKENSLENGLGKMAENFKIAKKLYPDASPEELVDLTTLMWNSPGKAKNKELVDFYLFGKNNPNKSKYNFDYVQKIKKNYNKYIDIKPKLVDDTFDFFPSGANYPQIRYEKGGEVKILKTKISNGKTLHLIED